MLCSSHRLVLNNGCCINAKMLQNYLTWLGDCNKAKALKLIYLDDPQDLGDIELVVPPYASLNINVIMDFQAITVLAKLLHDLLEPFINASLSLAQQVTHQSTFAHLLFSICCVHCHLFMPNQLYYDSQTLVKNAIFCIAKWQHLDVASTFYLLDVGNNPIKLLFAFLCMCGGHNSAINYKQAIDRLCAARDIGRVFSCHPDLHHGHWHLNLTHS
ncbi:hypothetical protein PAXRUDRAFT_36051 [Paxillus rubicundulus Ve08.2h10]|uniref:Uncharacterized protein n=1 Tax=Paxillus rubicundulus Ve08.2h10 TaxID=930991 RepID=A0A0D0DPM7_9AGAM|nr:hypothetical protein PAXRUDRAFT_36051 [Paxillus rubicundulus Ve08.2h10]